MAVREELIAAARGEVEVDLLLAGGRLANVLSGEVYPADVAIHRGRIVGFECSSAGRVLELDGRIIAPGFIDGHVHIESSMVSVPEYARAVVPRGTTTVVADPHELANVWGAEGIRYILDSSEDVPLNVYVMLPSCVPATDLETAGASLRAEDLAPLMQEDRVLGLAEMMNYPGVLLRDAEVMAKLALAEGRPVDGHAPGLSGRDLSAYIAAGIGSDHECTTIEEAQEKLRAGMQIMLREGSAAKNLRDLLPLVTPANAGRFLFVSDDRHPADLLGQGHIDFMVRTAVEQGLEPILALQIASINAARYFGLPHLGAIAPGYRADMVVLDDLESMRVAKVIKDGALVAEDGRLCVPLKPAGGADLRRMNIAPLGPGSFAIMAQPGPARVIGVVDQSDSHQIAISEAQNKGWICGLRYRAGHPEDGGGGEAQGHGQCGPGTGAGLRPGPRGHSHLSGPRLAQHRRGRRQRRGYAGRGPGGGSRWAAGWWPWLRAEVQARLPLPVAGLMSEARLEEVAAGTGELHCRGKGAGVQADGPLHDALFPVPAGDTGAEADG